MKNYDETINSVFERINEYEVEKKRKRKVITRTGTSLCCFCLVALLGIGVWQCGLFKTPPPTILDGDNSMLQGTDKTDEANSNINESAGITPDAPVIWGIANSESQDMGLSTWNGKTITVSLYDVLSDKNNKNSLIAIGVAFELDDKFVYNGKSIAEYNAEADNEHLYYNKLGELLKTGDTLKYGEALYKTGTPTGEKWAKQLYDETVERIGKDVLAKYIVDGEFLKEKLESDIDEYDLERRSYRVAYEVACEAYYQFVIDAAIEQLENQNIYCERRNGTDLVIYATADELFSLKIDNVLFYGLALRESEGMDMSETSVDDAIIE